MEQLSENKYCDYWDEGEEMVEKTKLKLKKENGVDY